MRDVGWVVAIALLALPGTIVWRVPLVAATTRGARWALAFPAGVLIASLLLYIYALLGVHWTRWNIALVLGPLALAGWYAGFSRPKRADQPPKGGGPMLMCAAFVILTIYAIADARATCGDLFYIWGPKAEAFAAARTIDTKFLALPFYNLMHPDYPPLVPLTYDVGTIFTHSFSWWGALFLTPIILLSIAGTLRGFGGSPLAAALLLGVLSVTFVSAYLPGGADPFLVLFESIAMIALTLAPESNQARWIAAGALAGAVFSKVEGTTFAIIVAIAFVLAQRRVLRAIALVAPAAVLLGTWLLFAWHHKLLDQYARAHSAMYWRQIPTVLVDVTKRARYHALWLPWLAALAPVAATRPWRRTAFPLLVAAGSLASTIFFYLHDPDPVLWIKTSADRILVTPLMCLTVAATAAWTSD